MCNKVQYRDGKRGRHPESLTHQGAGSVWRGRLWRGRCAWGNPDAHGATPLEQMDFFFYVKVELVSLGRERLVPVLSFQGTVFDGSVQLPECLGSFQSAQGNPSVAWISLLLQFMLVSAVNT